ncbi:hypothetical protein K438DRAFT_588875 [Mycena galopus ATCC 62051]|nr:hypothetical protein K438DRAFT_588875 [Mycena galopus ATCC 62051]
MGTSGFNICGQIILSQGLSWGKFPDAFGVFLNAYLQDARCASQQDATSLLPSLGRSHLVSFLVLLRSLISLLCATLNTVASPCGLEQAFSAELFSQQAAHHGAGLFPLTISEQVFQLIIVQGLMYALGR